jgi:hypothetical protein
LFSKWLIRQYQIIGELYMIKRDGFFKLASTLAVLSILSLTGCGGGGSSSTGNNSTGSNITPITGNIKFINNSATGHSIDEVYAVLTTSTSYGSKLNTSPIAAGSSWTLSGLSTGLYKARVGSVGTSSTYYAYGTNVLVTAGTIQSLTATDSNFTGSLIVTNNSGSPITALYVSPTAYGAGTSQITTSIANLSTYQLRGIPSGNYFVEAVINGIKKDVTASISSYSTTNISY